MKLSLNTDFTSFPRATSVVRACDASGEAAGSAALAHDERHLRRRVVELADGSRILADLPEPATLAAGDRLVIEDGRQIGIAAASEPLLAVSARDCAHLAELAWHIGSRHLAASFEAGRILILPDPAVRAILEGLGATLAEVSEPFFPVSDAGCAHDHDHGHDHDSPDAHGRLPGDPHYGHDHA